MGLVFLLPFESLVYKRVSCPWRKSQHKQGTAEEAGVECRTDVGGQGPAGGRREKAVGAEVVLGAGK